MVEAIMEAPVIVKVLGALSIILVINYFCKHLIVSVAVGALALALWSGHSAGGMARVAWGRLSSVSNLFLLLIVFQVIWLSSQMAETGIMEGLVAAVRARVSRRAAMGVLSAVIGLLPMPGGALFSAPLVDSCDTEGTIGAELKTQTNHWFRHIWEYWWPLYPGVLLALDITKLEVWQLVLVGVPLTGCAVAAGYWFLLRRIKPDPKGDEDHRQGKKPKLLPHVLPILIVIVTYALIKGGHASASRLGATLPPLNEYVPMAVGLFLAMLVLQRERPLGREQWRRILLSRRALNMVLIVLAVLIYGAFIEAPLPDGQELAAQMRAEMVDWGIPLLAILMLIPMVSGLATGLAIGFVGASFPIVMNLIGPDPTTGQVIATAALAYGFGYVGMLLSPVHVCLIVSSEHFKTSVLRNAAAMAKPAVFILIGALAEYGLIMALTG